MVYSKLWILYCQILLPTCIRLLLPSGCWYHTTFPFVLLVIIISDTSSKQASRILHHPSLLLASILQFLTPAYLCHYSQHQSSSLWAFYLSFFWVIIRYSLWHFAITMITCPSHPSLSFVLQLVLLSCFIKVDEHPSFHYTERGITCFKHYNF